MTSFKNLFIYIYLDTKGNYEKYNV